MSCQATQGGPSRACSEAFHSIRIHEHELLKDRTLCGLVRTAACAEAPGLGLGLLLPLRGGSLAAAPRLASLLAVADSGMYARLWL